jgi:hypothetical protein
VCVCGENHRPAERTEGAITERNMELASIHHNGTPVPPTVIPAAEAKGRKRWLKLTNV